MGEEDIKDTWPWQLISELGHTSEWRAISLKDTWKDGVIIVLLLFCNSFSYLRLVFCFSLYSFPFPFLLFFVATMGGICKIITILKTQLLS